MEKSPVRSDAYFPEWKPAFKEHRHVARVSWGLSQPTLSARPVGGNRSSRKKSITFGRALTNSFHISITTRIEPKISEVEGACSNDCLSKPLHYIAPVLVEEET